MGPDLILRYLSVCKERKEEIHDVVGECPAIVRVDCRPCGVIVEDVRQQGPYDCTIGSAQELAKWRNCLAFPRIPPNRICIARASFSSMLKEKGYSCD